LFATLLYAAFDPRSREVEYASCGRLPALLRRADGAVETLQDGGLPVGMFDNPKMSVSHAEMRQGDLFFLYTDGVTEASDANEIQFGDERLFDLLAGGNGATAAQWVARVEYAVRDFARGKPQFDDITCLALKR
jgi:phosphoserine phosphatase RsbU/P